MNIEEFREGAWHWNKKYWNQITLDGSVPDELILDLIRHAYAEVNKKLPKKERVTENLLLPKAKLEETNVDSYFKIVVQE